MHQIYTSLYYSIVKDLDHTIAVNDLFRIGAMNLNFEYRVKFLLIHPLFV